MSRSVSAVLAAGLVVLLGVAATATPGNTTSDPNARVGPTESGLLADTSSESSFGPLSARVAKPPHSVVGSDNGVIWSTR